MLGEEKTISKYRTEISGFFEISAEPIPQWRRTLTMEMLNTTIDFPSQVDGYSKILSLAALFQHNFSIDWLVELTEMRASQILEGLEQGVQQGTLNKVESKGLFCFTDRAQKEKWQNKLPREKKDRLHQRIVDILLNETMDEDHKAEFVAPHLLEISNDLVKCRWLVKAGDVHVKKYNNSEALECYAKAVDNLSNLHGQEADSLLSEAAIKYSRIFAASHDTIRILSGLHEATERAKRSNNYPRQALLKMHLAKNEWLRSRYRDAMRHFQEGWTITKELADPSLLRSASTFSTFFLYWQCRFQEAVRSYEQSLSDKRYSADDFPPFGALMVAHCYAMSGQVTKGLGMLQPILALCRDKGDKYLAAHALHAIGAIMLDTGRIEDAAQYLKCSIEEAKKGENKWIQILGKLSLAFASYLSEKPHRAMHYLREYIEMSRQVQATVLPYPHLMELCWAMEQGAFPRISGLSIEKEMRRMIREKNVFMKGVAYRYKALFQKKKGLPAKKVIHSLNQSLRYLQESGHQIELAKSQLELARQYLLFGDSIKAKETTQTASNILFSLNDALIPDDLRLLTKNQPLGESLLSEILNLGKELASFRKNGELVYCILSAVNRLFGAERGGLFLVETDTRIPRIHLRASKNLPAEVIAQPNFQASMKMMHQVVRTRQGCISHASSPEEIASTSDEIIRSSICVPIIRQNRVTGLLYLDNRLLPQAFRESDLELLGFFSSLAFLALEYGSVSDEVQRLNQKLREDKERFENQSLRRFHSEGIIGKSHAIRHVVALAHQVAKNNSNVLITGETGVGKELITRAIHRNSGRADKPFIQVHCSALPETLITSELFGHEKGAFTGAICRRIGRIELAHGGTLFLDEIGDLPSDIQVRLLRVLQSKEFERVGGNETLRSDFRLIAASNRDLEKQVRTNRFRSDLYYRLNVFPIYIPPLRERKEDIPLLANYFLRKHGTRLGKQFEDIPPKELERLSDYDWPGNVRELENIMERAIILSSGGALQIPAPDANRTYFGDAAETVCGHTLKENEKRHILWALEKTGWKVRGPGGAAEMLDIHPSTLEFRMKKLNIRRSSKLTTMKKHRKSSGSALS